jgi:hypothetical protein
MDTSLQVYDEIEFLKMRFETMSEVYRFRGSCSEA